MAPKVIFLLHATGRCGGIRVVCEYASRLTERGVDAEIWTPPAPKFSWYSRPLVHRVFNSLDELGRVARATRAAKVATWWETAYWTAETAIMGDRGFYLTQDIETTYANSAVERDRILSSYKLGLVPLPTSRWVETQLAQHSDTPAHFVGLGIDLDQFSPLPMAREQFRIFCPYRPEAGNGDLKGWLCARVVADHCRSLEPRTSLVTFGQSGSPRDIPDGLPHIHVSNVSDLKLRELYSQAGVFVMPSNHEGFGLTALEAMACGCPVVMTRCNGNGEYLKHGANCLSAGPGESSALGEHCAAIMQDAALASRLSYQGMETAREYDWRFAIDRMKAAIFS